MPLPGQYFCKKCLKPIPHPRNEGLCDSCYAKQIQALRMGNRCDHCGVPATKELIYVNKKTGKKYCTECRAIFHANLIARGFTVEQANKILVQDFILLNDPLKKRKIPKRK